MQHLPTISKLHLQRSTTAVDLLRTSPRTMKNSCSGSVLASKAWSSSRCAGKDKGDERSVLSGYYAEPLSSGSANPQSLPRLWPGNGIGFIPGMVNLRNVMTSSFGVVRQIGVRYFLCLCEKCIAFAWPFETFASEALMCTQRAHSVGKEDLRASNWEGVPVTCPSPRCLATSRS